MSTAMASPRLPSLIVVTGRPGSGKSTLVPALARAARCPALCRDELREGLINTIGTGSKADQLITRQVYDTFFATIELLLRRRISLIAEAAFQHKVWAPKLERLKPIASVRIIVLRVDAEVARARHVKRSTADPGRLQFHPEPALEGYDPPDMGVPMLSVDTTDGYHPGLAEIAAFARAGLSNPAV